MKINPYSLAAASMVLLSACATQETSWTPESVSPPPWTPVEIAPATTPAVEAPVSEFTPAEPAPERPVTPLSLSDAVVIAFENNRGIAVADLDPAITSTTVREARAEFDPILSASLRYGKDTNRTTTSSAWNATPTPQNDSATSSPSVSSVSAKRSRSARWWRRRAAAVAAPAAGGGGGSAAASALSRPLRVV